ncbi:endonuclease NucS [Mobiluncus curtisii]|uniref:endonuclease NucS n=1 Tax=Mobiluncus curtisii TaxID=2051 RepID=UPI0014701B87|nr:endonuclease NucS [Mobiluncus curtisii]NMW43344.1 endonuclease NucS [Mobiluncus curtisii]NMW82712.1 endonuclease NucS [Mobiluncus curtisii]NMW99528.1 endonuclease NucS [Mobiluncus curtisii]NMX05218.1 endonuclease NucS [Mobiluncus curtisii]
MRLVIADCEVNYSGRLDAHLAAAKRLLMVKADGSVLIHSDGGSYKPLNWMSPPCQLHIELEDPDSPQGPQTWRVQAKSGDALLINISTVYQDIVSDLGVDPGLEKDGVEAHLQKLLAEQVAVRLGEGWTLVRREWPTPIGPVDLLVRDAQGRPVAVEVKRRGEIDGVEQLTRYLDLLGRQADLEGITGIFAAQEIKPQARTLATDRGIRCVLLDYDDMRGLDFDAENRLF